MATKKGFTHEPQNSKQKEWYTPPEIFELLKFPEFDLDPASPGKDKVPQIPAKEHYTIKENGFMRNWHGRVWLNPPYGQDTAKWLNKLALYGNGIALVFARTDNLWFHTIACKADALCFLVGRVRFLDENGKHGSGAGCGSLLLAWGNECADILVNSGAGWCVDNRIKKDITKEILAGAINTILSWPLIFTENEKCQFCDSKYSLQFLDKHLPECPARILMEARNYYAEKLNS